ncbi:MAG TPA: hypothetical protein DCS97_06995 [Planctomycetes bacterium]|nr:hypothetical protein [Planctomycetota bacterium]
MQRLVKLDLPPQADLSAAPLWRVINPASGLTVEAPIEICGAGVRLWHERARAIAAEPGQWLEVEPLAAPVPG